RRCSKRSRPCAAAATSSGRSGCAPMADAVGAPLVLHGRRGAIIAAAAYPDAHDGWFEHAYWRDAGAVADETTGRGEVLVVEHGGEPWALRHYPRGGLVAKLIEDHYLWLGLERTRAFREWRLLASLAAAGLPVPRPVAARVNRTGPIYTAGIITRFPPGPRRLSAYLAGGAVPPDAR